MQESEHLDDLLEKTSRTFALCIPLLPGAVRRSVTVAYLLFRIADTLEDAWQWSGDRRRRELDEFEALMNGQRGRGEALAETWVRDLDLDHDGYRELMGDVPAVFDAFAALEADARACVQRHSIRTARRMGTFVERAGEDGFVALNDLSELRDYCYAVAGIVGELCTDLVLLDDPSLETVSAFLQHRARWFGEGLQLVNILKDSAVDAAEGRSFIPPSVPRGEVLALARQDLVAGAEYVLCLQEAKAHDGVVAFNAMPILLADETLTLLAVAGPGAKIGRERVGSLFFALQENIAEGRPVMDLEAMKAKRDAGD